MNLEQLMETMSCFVVVVVFSHVILYFEIGKDTSVIPSNYCKSMIS